jgi:hypothetical protein
MPDANYNTGNGIEEPVETEGGMQYSPFGPEEAPGIALVVNMRIYDVLMAIYTKLDPDGAADLMEIHTKGGIIGSLPLFDPSLLR